MGFFFLDQYWIPIKMKIKQILSNVITSMIDILKVFVSYFFFNDNLDFRELQIYK